MRISLALALVLVLFAAGCSSGEKVSIDDLQNIPADGETGLIVYDEHGNPVVPEAEGSNKGSKAPDFTITTTKGKEIRLSELTSNGEPVLVYFWTTWCPYCKLDFENIRKAYPEYEGKVRLIAIDMDLSEDMSKVKEYENWIGLKSVEFAPGNLDILRSYGVAYTTSKYAIGRNGIILWKGSGVINQTVWETLFEGLANS